MGLFKFIKNKITRGNVKKEKSNSRRIKDFIKGAVKTYWGMILMASFGSLLIGFVILLLVIALAVAAIFTFMGLVSSETDFIVSGGKFDSPYGASWTGDFVIGNSDLSKLPNKVRQRAELMLLVEQAVADKGLNYTLGDIRNLQILVLGINGVECGGKLGDKSILTDYIQIDTTANGANAIGPFQIVNQYKTSWLAGWPSRYPLPNKPSWSSSIQPGSWNDSDLFNFSNNTSPFWAPAWVYNMVGKVEAVIGNAEPYVRQAKAEGALNLSEEQIKQIASFVALTGNYHGAGQYTNGYTSYFLAELVHQYGDLAALSVTDEYLKNTPIHETRYAITPYGGTNRPATFPTPLLRLKGQSLNKYLVDIVGDYRRATKTTFNYSNSGTGDWYHVVRNSQLLSGDDGNGNAALNSSYPLMVYYDGKVKYDDVAKYFPKSTDTTGNGVVAGFNTSGKNGYIFPLADFPKNLSSLKGWRKYDGVVSYHKGNDFGRTTGTPVYAVAKGKVIKLVKELGSSAGLYIRIDHGKFIVTYMHLSKYPVGLAVGDTVEPGQCVGYVGGSGAAWNTYSPHLHVNMEVGDSGEMDAFKNILVSLYGYTKLEVINMSRSYNNKEAFKTLPVFSNKYFDVINKPWEDGGNYEDVKDKLPAGY